MDDLEKMLEAKDMPQAGVPRFQNELRKRLLDSFDAIRAAARLKKLLWVSSAAAVFLIAVSVVFVAKPSVPLALNERLLGERVGVEEPVRAPAKAGVDSKAEIAAPAPAPAADPFVLAVEKNSAELENLLKEMGRGRPSPRIRSVDACTVSKYKLSNDKEIFVFTSLEPKGREARTVY